jgi:hypothetical protein
VCLCVGEGAFIPNESILFSSSLVSREERELLLGLGTGFKILQMLCGSTNWPSSVAIVITNNMALVKVQESTS